MQDVFGTLFELSTNPFSTEDRAAVEHYLATALATADAEALADGAWDSCDTCCDPGPDGDEGPGPDVNASGGQLAVR